MNLKDEYPTLYNKVLGAVIDDGRQIGDIIFSDEEKAKLKEIYNRIMTTQPSASCWSCETRDFVLVFLVVVVKNYQGDWSGSGFWDRIQPEIGIKPDYKTQLPALGKCLTSYGRPFFESSSSHCYVESLSYQAYSPQVSVKAFIRLAWSLFTDENVFDLTYFATETNLEICKAIIKSLNSHYKGVDFDTDFVFESSTYSIRAGLRYAFSQDANGVSKMLSRILTYIDYIYQHRSDVSDEEGYLGKLCNSTVPQLIASYRFPIDKPIRKSRDTIDDIQRIRAFFVLTNGQVFLYIPKVRLYKEDQQYGKAHIVLTININGVENELLNEEYECYGEDYKHVLPEIYLPISEYLDLCPSSFDFRVMVQFDNENICYDSKKTLFRNFIVFNEESEIKQKTVSPGQYHIVFPMDFIIKLNVHSSSVPCKINETMVAFDLNDGDRISYNGTYVFFGKKESGSHFLFDEFTSDRLPMISFSRSGLIYNVYKKLEKLIIKSDDAVVASHLDIQFYANDLSLINSKPLINEISDGGVYIASLNEEIIKCQEQGISAFTLVIKDIVNDKTMFEENIAVIPSLEVVCSDPYYLSDKPVKTEINFFGCNYSHVSSSDSFDDFISTPSGDFVITLPYFSWRINEQISRNHPLDSNLPLLKEYFQSNDLIIISSSLENIRVFCGSIEIEKSQSKKEFYFGKFLFSSSGHDAIVNNNDVYALAIVDGVEQRLDLFASTDEYYLIDENYSSFLLLNENSVIVDLQNNFEGDKNVTFEICFQSSNNPNKKPITLCGKMALERCELEYIDSDEYEVTLSYFDHTMKRVLWKENIEVGDMNTIRFSNVSTVYITKISRIKINGLFLTDIAYVGDDGFGPTYSCYLHIPSSKKREKAFFIANGNNNICSLRYELNDKICDYSMDKSNRMVSHETVDGKRFIDCLSIYTKKE